MVYTVILVILFLFYLFFMISITVKLYRIASKFGISFYNSLSDTSSSFYNNNRTSLTLHRKISNYFLPLEIIRSLSFLFFLFLFREIIFNLRIDFIYFLLFIFCHIFIFFFSYKLFLLEINVLKNDTSHIKYSSYIDIDTQYDVLMKKEFNVKKYRFIILKKFFVRYFYILFLFIFFIIFYILSKHFMLDSHIIFLLFIVSFCLLIVVGIVAVFLFELVENLAKFPKKLSFDEYFLYINNYKIENDSIDSIEIYDIKNLYNSRVRYMRVNSFDCSYIVFFDIMVDNEVNYIDFDNLVLSFEKKYSYKTKFFSSFRNDD